MILSRRDLEKRENEALAPYAFRSAESKGRKFPEKPDKYRLCFQKDKERVIHSKAFRRLDKKTQVFISGAGDHYRTRLTHSLEVAQIARAIARQLGVNEDLSEVIGLAHDLGHPPFGHSGETALNEIMQGYGLHFEHNEQSQRVVERLEKSYPNFDGLNLSVEVLDGLMKHQTVYDQAGKSAFDKVSVEAQIVNYADEIAYTNHDIDDALRGELIHLNDLSGFALWKRALERVSGKYGENLDEKVLISRAISSLMKNMIEDLIIHTDKNLPLVGFSDEMKKELEEIRNFLFSNFYLNPRITKFSEAGKVRIKELFEYFMKNPSDLPFEFDKDERPEVQVKDYIAGMTDDYLVAENKKYANIKPL